jgi:hypothetical protein
LAKVWEHVLNEDPNTELTQKQIYACWARLNKDTWHLSNEQVQSAIKVLEACDNTQVEIIPVPNEPNIISLAFAFKEVFTEFGADVQEIAMDSTCM